MRTKISRWGNGLALRIPAAFADDASLAEGTPVELTFVGGELHIVPVRPELDLDSLLEAITDDNRHDETDWGKASGAEVW